MEAPCNGFEPFNGFPAASWMQDAAPASHRHHHHRPQHSGQGPSHPSTTSHNTTTHAIAHNATREDLPHAWQHAARDCTDDAAAHPVAVSATLPSSAIRASQTPSPPPTPAAGKPWGVGLSSRTSSKRAAPQQQPAPSAGGAAVAAAAAAAAEEQAAAQGGGAAANAAASPSTAPPVTILVAKVLTQSDASSGRIILPRACVEANMAFVIPYRSYSLAVSDAAGRRWDFVVKSWANGNEQRRVYVLDQTLKYIKELGLVSGDTVGLCITTDGTVVVEANSAAVISAAKNPTYGAPAMQPSPGAAPLELLVAAVDEPAGPAGPALCVRSHGCVKLRNHAGFCSVPRTAPPPSSSGLNKKQQQQQQSPQLQARHGIKVDRGDPCDRTTPGHESGSEQQQQQHTHHHHHHHPHRHHHHHHQEHQHYQQQQETDVGASMGARPGTRPSPPLSCGVHEAAAVLMRIQDDATLCLPTVQAMAERKGSHCTFQPAGAAACPQGDAAEQLVGSRHVAGMMVMQQQQQQSQWQQRQGRVRAERSSEWRDEEGLWGQTPLDRLTSSSPQVLHSTDDKRRQQAPHRAPAEQRDAADFHNPPPPPAPFSDPPANAAACTSSPQNAWAITSPPRAHSVPAAPGGTSVGRGDRPPAASRHSRKRAERPDVRERAGGGGSGSSGGGGGSGSSGKASCSRTAGCTKPARHTGFCSGHGGFRRKAEAPTTTNGDGHRVKAPAVCPANPAAVIDPGTSPTAPVHPRLSFHATEQRWRETLAGHHHPAVSAAPSTSHDRDGVSPDVMCPASTSTHPPPMQQQQQQSASYVPDAPPQPPPRLRGKKNGHVWSVPQSSAAQPQSGGRCHGVVEAAAGHEVFAGCAPTQALDVCRAVGV